MGIARLWEQPVSPAGYSSDSEIGLAETGFRGMLGEKGAKGSFLIYPQQEVFAKNLGAFAQNLTFREPLVKKS
jgi:hypothetical protein